MKIPTHPQLRPGIELIAVDNQTALVRSFSGTIMLTGEFVSSKLSSLLSYLDGRNSIQEITEKLGEAFRPELEKFLILMTEKQLLRDEDVEHHDSSPFPSSNHETAYWSIYGKTANQALNRLQASTVVVANLGGVGANVVRSLVAAGVGKIVAIDPERVQSSDETFGYQAEDVGKPRVEVLASYVNSTRKCKEFVPVAAGIADLSNWAELVSQADLVVLASDNMSLAGYEKTNEACIRHKTNWVSARIDRSRAIIGPFVVPEQTACFTCFELRNRANSEHPEDHEAIYRHWKETSLTPDDWPTVTPYAEIVGGYLTLDIQRVLGGGHLSMFSGRLLHIDLHTFESRFHELLKLPRCPACSRARNRPLTRIWDIRPAAESHTSS